jgi:capsular polysaccharide biosynthesis protein
MALLWEKKIGIFLAGLFVAAASFFVMTATAERYAVRTDFLVVQTTGAQDYYTLFKSSEYLGKILAEAVYSERFLNAMGETGKVGKEFLPTDKQARLAAWRSMVTIEKNSELGLLSVRVKGDTEREAGRVMQALSEVLVTKNAEFRGGDEKSVELRVLTGPITEKNPSLKELALVALLGFLAGALLRALWLAGGSIAPVGYRG